jgi:alpha-N-acetylglucosaminidase
VFPRFLRFDLVDISRQFLANLATGQYKEAMKSFGEKDRDGFVDKSNSFLQILRDLDRMLSTDSHFMLGPWLESAKRLGSDDAEKKLLEFNARNQVWIVLKRMMLFSRAFKVKNTLKF